MSKPHVRSGFIHSHSYICFQCRLGIPTRRTFHRSLPSLSYEEAGTQRRAEPVRVRVIGAVNGSSLVQRRVSRRYTLPPTMEPSSKYGLHTSTALDSQEGIACGKSSSERKPNTKQSFLTRNHRQRENIDRGGLPKPRMRLTDALLSDGASPRHTTPGVCPSRRLGGEAQPQSAVVETPPKYTTTKKVAQGPPRKLQKPQKSYGTKTLDLTFLEKEPPQIYNKGGSKDLARFLVGKAEMLSDDVKRLVQQLGSLLKNPSNHESLCGRLFDLASNPRPSNNTKTVNEQSSCQDVATEPGQFRRASLGSALSRTQVTRTSSAAIVRYCQSNGPRIPEVGYQNASFGTVDHTSSATCKS